MTTFTKTALFGATMLTAVSAAHADEEAILVNEYLLDEELTIAENAAKVEDFTTLMTAVQEAGLADELMGDGPYTVFAPTNEAFAALPEGTVESLLEPANRDALIGLVSAHVVPATVTAQEFDLAALGDDIAESGEIRVDVENNSVLMDSISASDVRVEKIGDEFYATAFPEGAEVEAPDATIIYSDIMASNGVIHIIDSVLSPDA